MVAPGCLGLAMPGLYLEQSRGTQLRVAAQAGGGNITAAVLAGEALGHGPVEGPRHGPELAPEHSASPRSLRRSFLLFLFLYLSALSVSYWYCCWPRVHFTMEPLALLHQSIPEGHSAFIYILLGQVLVAGVTADANHCLVLTAAPGEDGVTVRTESSEASFFLCDKTFFIAALLAMRHDRLAVFFGSAGALAAMTALSATIGLVLPKLMPRKYTHWAAVALFVYFGLKLLWEALQMLRSGSGSGTHGGTSIKRSSILSNLWKIVDARSAAAAACRTVPCQATNINQQMQSDVGQLERALTAALEVVEAQRAQLAAAQEEAARLQLELEREQQARTAAEEKLREASVEFARKLSSMQAKVVEAERDVVLGGQASVLSLRCLAMQRSQVSAVPSASRTEAQALRVLSLLRRDPPGGAPGTASALTDRAAFPELSPHQLASAAKQQLAGIFASAAQRILRPWLPGLVEPSEELEEVEQSLKEESPKAKQTWAVAGQALTLTFLAEWGDRSQISTIALAAAKDPLGPRGPGGSCPGRAHLRADGRHRRRGPFPLLCPAWGDCRLGLILPPRHQHCKEGGRMTRAVSP
eukprot:s451_g3.t4